MATYNIEADVNGNTAPNPGTDLVLESIGSQTVNGFAHQLDIITLQETTSNTATVQPLVNSLNGFYGAGVYAMSPLQAGEIGNSPASGNGPNALIYNTQTLQLVSSFAFGTLSGSGMSRQEVRYQFRPVGYTSSADFYVYTGHYKAQNDGTSQTRRNYEANAVRADAATLPAGSRIVYTGDFNLTQGSSEAAWATLTAAGTGTMTSGQAIDPINLGGGAWANGNAALVSNYSESTAQLNARFDFQFQTPATMSGHAVSYIDGSYRVFGNGGVALNGATGNANLASASDHYPVVADYRIPARMAVAVGAAPATVIQGASVGVPVTVTNSAPVIVAGGAELLQYSISGSGNLTGSDVSKVAPLATGVPKTLSLATASPGVSSGTINVTSSTLAVPNPNFTQAVSTTVLSHAHPSFDAAANTASITLDFGIRALGFTAPQQAFAVQNRPDASGFTAGLDLDSITGTGATGALTTNATTFTNLAAGGSAAFNASINTGTVGLFNATYALATSDQNLPGAISTGSLTLNLTGRVALGGDANLDNTVDLTDFTILASNFNAAGKTWQTGDFNADGSVDLTDFTMLASDFNRTVTPAAELGTTVPEPAVAGAFALVAAGLASGRMRRRVGR